MLSGRLLEGAGMSLIAWSARHCGIWFSPDQRGKAMGIFATWVPLGSTVVFLLAPSLAHAGVGGGLVVRIPLYFFRWNPFLPIR